MNHKTLLVVLVILFVLGVYAAVALMVFPLLGVGVVRL